MAEESLDPNALAYLAELEFEKNAIAIAGLAFAAFCLWLAIRLFNRRETWAKWTAGAAAMLLAYPISAGPAVWACARDIISEPALVRIYAPIFWLIDNPSRPLYDTWIGNQFEWYVDLWS